MRWQLHVLPNNRVNQTWNLGLGDKHSLILRMRHAGYAERSTGRE